jgi:hypothetical protein
MSELLKRKLSIEAGLLTRALFTLYGRANHYNPARISRAYVKSIDRHERRVLSQYPAFSKTLAELDKEHDDQ